MKNAFEFIHFKYSCREAANGGVLRKKVFLKNLAKFTGKQMCVTST